MPQSANWVCNPQLLGGSSKKRPAATILADALNTLSQEDQNFIWTIYTDGSADEGDKKGGSAAVVTSGQSRNPIHIKS